MEDTAVFCAAEANRSRMKDEETPEICTHPHVNTLPCEYI